MDTATFFKRLVIGKTALYVFWLALPWIQARFVSADVAAALTWYGIDAILPLPTGLAWLVVLLYIPAAIGLCSFSHSARWLFVALTAFGLVWSLSGGLRVETALGAALGFIVTLGDGAIITLSFTSPLRERFERHELAANHALQRTQPERRARNRRVPRPGR